MGEPFPPYQPQAQPQPPTGQPIHPPPAQPPQYPPAPIPPGPGTPQKKNGWKGWVGVLAFFAVVAGCSVLISNGSDDDSDSGLSAAFSACEDAVRDRLKAPTTAEFSNEQYTQVSETKYNLAGDVDAQNSFGAMIRSHWRCVAIGPEPWHTRVIDIV